MQNFEIKFRQDDIHIDMGNIDINFYCLELVNPIAKISYYYQFFPLWIDFHFMQKHMVDDDYKEIYIEEQAERNKVNLKFDCVKIKINEYEISSAAILQANIDEINKHTNNQTMVNYLRNIKSNEFSVIVNNFTISTEGFREKVCQYYEVDEKVYYYYKNIIDSKNYFLIFF